MTAQRIRNLIALLACCSMLAACSSRPSVPGEAIAERVRVKKIAVVPVNDPYPLTVENRGSALNLLALPGMLIQKQIADERSQYLASALKKQSLQIGEEISALLQKELSLAGYEAVVLKDVERPLENPDDFDLDSIQTDADAILSARFFSAGLYSAQFSTDFVPRLSLQIEMQARKDQAELYSESIYYGADARRAAPDQILADPKYAYGSFGTAMEKSDELAESFRQGIRQIAARVAKHLRDGGI